MVLHEFNMNMQSIADKRLSVCILMLFLELFFEGAKASVTHGEIERHLELGRDFLARGQLGDALTHYHAAVEGDPENYLTYFKRGTVYLALGKAKFALNDFSKVLELKPDFTAARYQRGNVYMKLGDYDKAEWDLYEVLNVDPYHADATYLYGRIPAARNQVIYVHNTLKDGDHHHATTLLTQLLEMSPWSQKFREMRAESHINQGDILAAVSDLRSVNRLSQDNTDGYHRIADLLYQLGHATDALKEIRECLKLDPEHKLCFPLYKRLRKVEKALTDAEDFRNDKEYAECIKSAERVLKHEKEVPMIIFSAKQLICSCEVKEGKYNNALQTCTGALDLHKDATVLCDRAEAYLESEMYDDAVRDYQAALEIDEHLQRAKEGIERTRARQKQAEKRDYYKILGVDRKATDKQIQKAYRKAAMKWHPDKYDGAEKKIAEKKFIDIAAAKEVLLDAEKRRQFDMGEDPLDPEAGHGGAFRHGHNPFQHFQYDSPFQFKFHFN